MEIFKNPLLFPGQHPHPKSSSGLPRLPLSSGKACSKRLQTLSPKRRLSTRTAGTCRHAVIMTSLTMLRECVGNATTDRAATPSWLPGAPTRTPQTTPRAFAKTATSTVIRSKRGKARNFYKTPSDTIFWQASTMKARWNNLTSQQKRSIFASSTLPSSEGPPSESNRLNCLITTHSFYGPFIFPLHESTRMPIG